MAQFSGGTIFQVGDGGGPEEFTSIADVLAINGVNFTLEVLDSTNLEDIARARIDLNFEPDNATQTGFLSRLEAKSINTYRIIWPTFPTVQLGDTIVRAGNTFDSSGAHELFTGQKIWFVTTDTLPTSSPQINETVPWFVAVVDSDTFTVYTTSLDAMAGTNQVTMSNGGSGTHSFVADALEVASVTAGTDTITTTQNHDLRTGQPFQFIGSVPSALATLTTYYAIRTGATTFKPALTNALAIGGTPIDIADDGATFFVAQATTWEFSALVTDATPTASTGEKLLATLTLNITDTVTFIA